MTMMSSLKVRSACLWVCVSVLPVAQHAQNVLNLHSNWWRASGGQSLWMCLPGQKQPHNLVHFQIRRCFGWKRLLVLSLLGYATHDLGPIRDLESWTPCCADVVTFSKYTTLSFKYYVTFSVVLRCSTETQSLTPEQVARLEKNPFNSKKSGAGPRRRTRGDRTGRRQKEHKNRNCNFAQSTVSI